MIQNILVPLDGSEVSESVLPYATAIAKSIGANVTLLNAINEPMVEFFVDEPVDWSMMDEIEAAAMRSAQDYVSSKVSALEAQGLTTSGHVLRGRASEVILDYISEHSPDLVAMSTHGRSGIGRLVLGSIATHVLAHVDVPLLLVHPKEEEPRLSSTLTDILVPLDMSEHGEAILPLACDLAKGLKLKVTLTIAVPTISQFYVGTEPVAYPTNVLDILDEAMKEYMTDTAAKIKADYGIDAEVKVLQGDPGEAIINYARDEMQDNIIAMSTHGRSGLGRWVLGSVTDKVVRRSGDPVLIVHPEE